MQYSEYTSEEATSNLVNKISVAMGTFCTRLFNEYTASYIHDFMHVQKV